MFKMKSFGLGPRSPTWPSALETHLALVSRGLTRGPPLKELKQVLGLGCEVLGLGYKVLGPGSEVLGLGYEGLGPG